MPASLEAISGSSFLTTTEATPGPRVCRTKGSIQDLAAQRFILMASEYWQFGRSQKELTRSRLTIAKSCGLNRSVYKTYPLRKRNFTRILEFSRTASGRFQQISTS